MGTIGIYRRCKKRFQGVWKYDTGLKWVKGNIYSSLQIRSSSSQIFFKIGVLKNLDNFSGNYMCWSHFLIKLYVWRPAILLKKTPIQVFSCKYCEIFKSIFFYGTPLMTASADLPLSWKIWLKLLENQKVRNPLTTRNSLDLKAMQSRT